MLEKALSGSNRYWAWIFFLLAVIGIGCIAYMKQLNEGLGITGLSRDVSWGLYIGQFTFLVGVAASAVMLVIPYYLHDFKKFSKIVILGEFSLFSCYHVRLIHHGRYGPAMRVANILLHPTPGSIVFWDVVVLNGYLLLNLIIGWTTLGADRKGSSLPTGSSL